VLSNWFSFASSSFLHSANSDSIMGLSWDYLEDRKKEEREREKKAREDTRKAFIFLLDETVQAAEDAGLDERKLHLVQGWRSTLKTVLGLSEGHQILPALLDKTGETTAFILISYLKNAIYFRDGVRSSD